MASGLYCVATVLGSADGEHFHHKEFYQRAKEAGDKRGGGKQSSQKERGRIFYHFDKTTKEQGLEQKARKAVLPGSPS